MEKIEQKQREKIQAFGRLAKQASKLGRPYICGGRPFVRIVSFSFSAADYLFYSLDESGSFSSAPFNIYTPQLTRVVHKWFTKRTTGRKFDIAITRCF